MAEAKSVTLPVKVEFDEKKLQDLILAANSLKGHLAKIGDAFDSITKELSQLQKDIQSE